jgi:hypothetical protein
MSQAQSSVKLRTISCHIQIAFKSAIHMENSLQFIGLLKQVVLL